MNSRPGGPETGSSQHINFITSMLDGVHEVNVPHVGRYEQVAFPGTIFTLASSEELCTPDTPLFVVAGQHPALYAITQDIYTTVTITSFDNNFHPLPPLIFNEQTPIPDVRRVYLDADSAKEQREKQQYRTFIATTLPTIKKLLAVFGADQKETYNRPGPRVIMFEGFTGHTRTQEQYFIGMEINSDGEPAIVVTVKTTQGSPFFIYPDRIERITYDRLPYCLGPETELISRIIRHASFQGRENTTYRIKTY